MPTICSLHFDVPAGFVDNTNYTFEAAERSEALSLNIYSDDTDDVSNEGVLARVRARAELLMPGSVKIRQERTVSIGSRKGKAVTIETNGQPPITDRLAVVTTSHNQVILFSYMRLRSVMGATAGFEQVLASVRFAHEPFTAPANGFYRAHALGISLDIPAHLNPPQTLLFASSRDVIQMRIVGAGPNGRHPPSLRASIVEHAARASSVDHVSFGTLERGAIVGEKVSYLWRITGIEQIVLLARFTVHGYQHVLFDVRGSLDCIKLCNQTFESVIESFR